MPETDHSAPTIVYDGELESDLARACESLGVTRGWIVYHGCDARTVIARTGDLPAHSDVWPRTQAIPFQDGTLEVYLAGSHSDVAAARLCARAVARLAEKRFQQRREVLRAARRRLHKEVCQALTAARLELELLQFEGGVARLKPALASLDVAAVGVRELMEELGEFA